MVTYGDFQTWCTEDLHRNLERIINAKSDRKIPYYIMVVFKHGYDGPPSKVDNHLLSGTEKVDGQQTIDLSGKTVIHTVITVLEPHHVPKIRLIGTALWRIDNRTGEVKCIYVLPPDKPIIGESFENGKAKESELVARSGRGMPLVYNS